jgi:hypothetical protein
MVRTCSKVNYQKHNVGCNPVYPKKKIPGAKKMLGLLISNNQNAFIVGIQILDSVLWQTNVWTVE